MDKLNQSLDLFTEGLRSDPEIRLDIRRELQSHLEEKIAEETAQGHSNEESLELALNTFGSPVEVADGLTAANRRRMNFRARMRLAAGTLLIPAVIICALLSLNMTSNFIYMTSGIDNPGKYFSGSSGKIFSFDILRGYTPEQKLILYGDSGKKNRVEQQKAIWEKFPDNKIYAANYIISLIGLGDTKDSDFIAEIGRAGKIDKDNALYNYLAAGILLKDACNVVSLPRGDKNARQQYKFELKDRALLEKAMHEYLAGANKKYCNSYTADLLKQRLQIMGEANSLTGQLEQMVLGAGTLLPQLGNYRNIARCMPEYANLLIKEGRKQEALQYLNTWKQFFQHVNSDGDWFIGVLVADAIARIDAEKLPPLYNNLDMVETAKTVTLETEILSNPVREWKEKKRDKNTIPYSRGGILPGMLLPALGREYSSEELAPERYAEYVLCQKITLSLINFILIIWMICAVGTALYWRFRSGAGLLLLSPPPLTILKIMGFGVALPCVVYFILSQIELLSGYDYGLAANGPRFIAQMTLLLLSIVAAVRILTGRYVEARCRELGVETPPPAGKIQKISAIACLAVLAFTAFAPLSMFAPLKPSPAALMLLIAGIILAMSIILRIAQWAAMLLRGREYSVYYGAIARTVMLTFALTVLVLTCIFRPVLDWREAGYIREDKIMFGSAESFTKVEGDVVRELKNAINQALAKISK